MLRVLGTALAIAIVGAAPASANWAALPDVAAPNAAGKSVGAPVVAVAPDGTAFAAFQHFDGANTRIGVAQRAPGGAFGPVRDLSPAGRDAFAPALAVDRQGNATLAWLQGPAFVVSARVRPAGGDWGETTPISAGPVGLGPSVAAGDGGAAAVAWGRRTGDEVARVEVAVRRAGQPFGEPAFVSPNAGNGVCKAPRVAMDAAGDVAVLWTRRTSALGGYRVESAVKPAAATAFEPAGLRSADNGNAGCNIDLELAPDGRVTAVWDFAESGPGAAPPYAAFADRTAPFATGAWRPAAKLSVPADASGQPLIAGDTLATWLSGGRILSRVRAGLGPFSTPKPLSGASDLDGQALAAGANGDAIAAFVGEANGAPAIFAARRRPGGEFGEIAPVVIPPAGTALTLPDVAVDDQGNALAVWQRRVGAAETAQVAAFDPVPPVVTALDVPATATAGVPVAMSAAATDRMPGLSLRFDFGDGSGADGAAVQHAYAAPGTYTVLVTATDGAGNTSGTTRTISVAAAPVVVSRPGTTRTPVLVAATWDLLRNGNTRMKTLRVEGLAGPETVKLACKGRGCRRSARRTVGRHGATVNLTKAVKGMVMRPRARLTITITPPGARPTVVTYAMVKYKDPKKTTR